MCHRVTRVWLEKLEDAIFSAEIKDMREFIKGDENCLIKLKFVKYFWQIISDHTKQWDRPREVFYQIREKWIEKNEQFIQKEPKSYGKIQDELIMFIGPAVKKLLRIPRVREKFKNKFDRQNEYNWENMVPMFKKNKNKQYNEMKKDIILTVFDYLLSKALPEVIEECQEVMESLFEIIPEIVYLDKEETNKLQIVTANAMASYRLHKLEGILGRDFDT